jgi:hypothetical protein
LKHDQLLCHYLNFSLKLGPELRRVSGIHSLEDVFSIAAVNVVVKVGTAESSSLDSDLCFTRSGRRDGALGLPREEDGERAATAKEGASLLGASPWLRAIQRRGSPE